MRGRKPKPQGIADLHGNPGKRRRRPVLPVEAAASLAPPATLGADGAEHWRARIAASHRLGLATQMDLGLLEAACKHYERAIVAERQIAEKGFLVRTPAGGVKASPLLGVANRAWELYLRFCAEIGWTPVSRTRLAVADAPRTAASPETIDGAPAQGLGGYLAAKPDALH